MKRNKFDILSFLWTLLLHIAVVGLLLLLHLNRPVVQAESGVPVMLGDMGNLDTDYDFTEVNSIPAPAPASVPVPVAPQAEPAITQNMEETVAIETGEKEKPVNPVETVRQPTPEEIRAEQERQQQEEKNILTADVFARSRNMQASSTQENNSDTNGTPGSTDGNSEEGKESGIGGSGGGPVPGLDGRKVVGSIPIPSNENLPEAAMVVVNIWVDPDGNVTRTSISNRTKTMNADLRQRSIEAARKTKFNRIDGVNEAQGTITYFYQFKK